MRKSHAKTKKTHKIPVLWELSDLSSAAHLPALMSDGSQPSLLSIPGLQDERKADKPCTIVIFGASGEFTVRNLIPMAGFAHHLF